LILSLAQRITKKSSNEGTVGYVISKVMLIDIRGVTEKEVTGMRTASKGDKAIALAQVNTQY
jgi:hypothetical protein